MTEVVVFDDDDVVITRVRAWISNNPVLGLELNEGLSSPVPPDGWRAVKDRVEQVKTDSLVFLDLRLKFDDETQDSIPMNLGRFPSAKSNQARDGFAIASLLIRADKQCLVILNSTIGVGSDFIDALNDLKRALRKGYGVTFKSAPTALSEGIEQTDKAMRFAVAELGLEPALSEERECQMQGKEDFRESLHAICDRHSLYDSKLVQYLSSSEQVDLESLRRFASLYYPHVLRTRRYQASALASCPDERVQSALAQIIYDEFGLGDSSRTHPELYRNFLKAIGVSSEEWVSEGQFVEMKLYIDSLSTLDHSESWRFVVGAVGLGGELPIPRLYRGFLTGMRSLEIESYGLEIFQLHIQVDETHSRLLLDSLSDACYTAEDQEEVISGLKFSLDARAMVFDALGRLILGSGNDEN